jgi:hypothetical protein
MASGSSFAWIEKIERLESSGLGMKEKAYAYSLLTIPLTGFLVARLQ